MPPRVVQPFIRQAGDDTNRGSEFNNRQLCIQILFQGSTLRCLVHEIKKEAALVNRPDGRTIKAELTPADRHTIAAKLNEFPNPPMIFPHPNGAGYAFVYSRIKRLLLVYQN